MRISSDNIVDLKHNEIFVFGSNLGGRHGKGAAKHALKFGAILGCGWGEYGQTFAIPTKTADLKILKISSIEFYVDMFLKIAEARPENNYLVTKIGCGLSNYKTEEIAPLFRRGLELENVYLPLDFLNFLNSD